MNSTTRCLEVDEKFPRGNQSVVGIGPLEFADPHAFNNFDETFTRFVFRRFISGEVEDAGLFYGLLPLLHRWFVFPDGRIADSRFWREGECVGVICYVNC